jgi:hypothetical protein
VYVEGPDGARALWRWVQEVERRVYRVEFYTEDLSALVDALQAGPAPVVSFWELVKRRWSR